MELNCSNEGQKLFDYVITIIMLSVCDCHQSHSYFTPFWIREGKSPVPEHA